ncbi:MAG: maleylpyruvate isomerase [Acidimicrobiaceae bacterium]
MRPRIMRHLKPLDVRAERRNIAVVVTVDGLSQELVTAVEQRTAHIVDTLDAVDDDALLAPTDLPGWSRLTIACHLRYGAEALCRMTGGAVAGESTAYYPGGREQQRPLTLLPYPGERPIDVVTSLAHHSDELSQAWFSLDEDGWRLEVTEPVDNPDLGPLSVARLPLLRLTEVEVHGSDLGLGLDDWSELFVRVALPVRLDWLNTRRSNHRGFDASVAGSWLLVATDGPTYLVTVTGSTVESHPATSSSPARAVVEATSRDLLALLLGRSFRTPPRVSGDVAFGHAFGRAFPGP